jgi:(2R)-ethylmalonyl-CoA mutase
VVGVNRYREAEPSPLTAGIDSIFTTDPAAEADQIARLHAWRAERDGVAVNRALLRLREAALSGENMMPPSIAAAKAGVTTGEWGAAIRAAFGEYRAPTGVNPAASNRTEGLEPIRAAVDLVSSRLGRRLKLLIGKPGLDGHSNGAEQITARARDCGMAIHYDGIRHTPADIVAQALEENPHVIGLSILSGSHMPLVADVLAGLREAGLSTPLIIGGIIPETDAQAMLAMGVAAIYTPKDFDLNRIMFDIVGLAEGKAEAA